MACCFRQSSENRCIGHLTSIFWHRKINYSCYVLSGLDILSVSPFLSLWRNDNKVLFSQKLKKEIHHETNGEKTNGEKSNGGKTNGEKTNGEKANEENRNGKMTNGIKHEDSPPPVKKQTDSSLTDIEEAIPDTTNDQKIMDRVLDKTRCINLRVYKGNWICYCVGAVSL